jgi:flagellar biosynthesis component FlhA
MSMVKHLPSITKALDLIPSTTKISNNKKKKQKKDKKDMKEKRKKKKEEEEEKIKKMKKKEEEELPLGKWKQFSESYLNEYKL